MLKFEMGKKTIQKGEELWDKIPNCRCTLYRGAYKEFCCYRLEMKSGESKPFKFEFPYIILVYEGEGLLSITDEKTNAIEQYPILRGNQIYIIPTYKFAFLTKDTLVVYFCGSFA